MADLVEFMHREGYKILSTREPGGTPIGDQIRSLLFDFKHSDMQPTTEILLFQASRAQLVSQVIRPNLAQGSIVLCDRYADSTIAYQGYGHQVDLDSLKRVIHFATGGLKPNLTLLLDVDVEVGLQRRSSGGDWNRLDAFELEFHQRVRRGYLEMAEAEPERWFVINAGRSLEEVQAEIRRTVLAKIQSAV
jgi:dTMP kinase